MTRNYAILFLVLWALAQSLFWTWLNYPGVLSTDSLMMVNEVLSGRYSGQHSTLMVFLMKLCFWVFGQRWVGYTLFQSFLMFSGIAFFLHTVIPQSKKTLAWAVLGVSFFTPLWIYPVIWWKDTLLAICLVWSLAFVLRLYKDKKYSNLLGFAFFLNLGILSRQNALLLIFPALFLLLVIYRNEIVRRGKRLLYLALMFFCVLVWSLSPKIVNRLAHVEANGFGKIIFGAIYAGWMNTHHQLGKQADPESLSFWNAALNDSHGYEKLVSRPRKCGDEWDYILDSSLNLSREQEVLAQTPGAFPGLLLRFALRNPTTALSYLLCHERRLLDGKDSAQYWFHLGVEKNDLGLSAQTPIPALYEAYRKVLYYSFLGGLSRHYVYLSLSLLFILASILIFLKGAPSCFEKLGIAPFLYFAAPIFSLSYHFTFLLVPAATDWRYLFPSTLLTALTGIVTLAVFVEKAIEKLRKKLLKSE